MDNNNNLLQARTLIVGIGGTGFHILSRVKELTKQLYGEIPLGIRFLSLDTGALNDNKNDFDKIFGYESDIEAGDPYQTTEWLKITGNGNFKYKDNLKTLNVKEDININIDDLFKTIRNINFSKGAGQKRVLGKIAFYFHRTNIEKKLQKALDVICNNDIGGVEDQRSINVYVVGSIAGGSGSGIFIDTIVLLEKLLNKKNLTTNLFTFNLLPEIYLKEKSGVWPSNVYPNAFASVCELEYLYENLNHFIPTKENRTLSELGVELPKYNFLIDNIVYEGVDVNHKSMINATAYTISHICNSTGGGGTQVGNSDVNVKADKHNKPKKFSSLGYSEINFDLPLLKDFAFREILNKSWKDYEYNDADQVQISFEQIKTWLNDVLFNNSLNLFENNINFDRPKIDTKKRINITSELETHQNKYKTELSNGVRESFDKVKLDSKIDNYLKTILVSSNDESIVNSKKEELIELLTHLKARLSDQTVHQEEILKFRKIKERYFNAITGKKEKEYKTFFNLFTKEKKYKKYIKDTVDKYITNVKTFYANIVIEEEHKKQLAFYLGNKIIDIGQGNIDMDISNETYGEINKYLGTFNLPKSNHNIIHLEAYFEEIVKGKIKEDSNIGKGIIEGFLSDTSIKSIKDYILSLSNLPVIGYLNTMKEKDLSDIKKLLDNQSIKEINGKFINTAKPLWDRESDWIITHEESQDTMDTGDLMRYEFLEVPDKSKDYFGKGNFTIKEADITNITDKHRQSYIVIEEGLPAYNFKSLWKFKEELDKKTNKVHTVENFVYEEIRQKYLNGSISPYIFEGTDDKERRKKALRLWALGWATGFIFKDGIAGRIKVKVYDDFKPNITSLLRNGVYDAFKDISETANLIKIFNKFKDMKDLLDDLELQIKDLENSNRESLLDNLIERFEVTNATDPNHKFRTEKKAFSAIEKNQDEYDLIISEEKTLIDYINYLSKKTKEDVIWSEETVNNNIYKRVKRV